jgi:hypothetical protein
MKMMFFSASLLLFILHSSQAQPTKFHYALNDGDIFQYWVDFGGPPGTRTVKIVGDTLMPNGKSYKIMKSDFRGLSSTGFIRVADQDSVLGLVPTMGGESTEILLYRLNLEIGLTWPPPFEDFAYYEITAIRDTTLWDNTLKYAVVASYSSIDSTLFWTQDFLWADTLGVIVDYDEGGSEELTGAVINGKTYGTITSVEPDLLQSLYPLHIGDYWEYNTTGIIPTVYKEVVGDTTMANGQTYFVVVWDDDFAHEYADTLFERVTDDFNVVQYFSNNKGAGEQEIYKLGAKQGESWTSSDSLTSSTVTLDTIETTSLFTQERLYYLYSFPFLEFDGLAEDLGLFNSGSTLGDGGTIRLRGAIIDGNIYGDVSSVQDDETRQPDTFALLQNYPNPFNPTTTIKIELNNTIPQRTVLAVYNILGQPITTLLDGLLTQGTHEFYWNGRNDSGQPVPSGIYFCRLTQEARAFSRQMLLVK